MNPHNRYSLTHATVLPPPSSPEAVEDGREGSWLYITNEAFVNLSCGWVDEGRERQKGHQDGRGGWKESERGRIKRNEDRRGKRGRMKRCREREGGGKQRTKY